MHKLVLLNRDNEFDIWVNKILQITELSLCNTGCRFLKMEEQCFSNYI